MNKILTSLSALYEQDFISFKPASIYIEMLHGANTTYYVAKQYNIKLQKKETFELGVITKNNIKMYGPERLFIELDKFKLENTLKQEAINNLEKVINPFVVEKLYLKLQKKRRGYDKERIEKFLKKKFFNMKEILIASDDKKQIIREYILILLSKNENVFSLITKGGSAIEILLLVQRSALDIDSHAGHDEIDKIVHILQNRDYPIYFEAKNEINYDKKIIKIELQPFSRSSIISNLIQNIPFIPLNLNTTYPKEEIQYIIKEYNLQKTPLKRISNYSVMTFSKEMILAEKFKTLIFNPEIQKRTKDLIDLFLLWSEEIDQKKFLNWFWKKTSKAENSKDKTKEEIIKVNQTKPLSKIKDNFDDAISQYELSITYEECLKIYKKIIKLLI
ncbi:MAG: nucleotidyl transferase AbiEii/AbiGii toxin family protein [Metamycoplasmataceae bacterium]